MLSASGFNGAVEGGGFKNKSLEKKMFFSFSDFYMFTAYLAKERVLQNTEEHLMVTNL